ncbi:MAG: SMC-Scp complex subunit ScpB [Clostridia bacterium]|nr:SMC-Scp complex subunit ScpB [Clostridia bacterium]
MNNLTNIIEAIVFASGEPVPVKYIMEKAGCTLKEANASIAELKEKYSGDCGIHILTFNGKLQFASNPAYKEIISSAITPIKEKELTRAVLECAALIAYKQPVTRSELEDVRGVSCDYAVNVLLDLEMIYPCGRKDTIGKPIQFATTDNFLKRFRLNSIDELPDYDDLMEQIAQLQSLQYGGEEEDDGNYLYKKDVYNPDSDEENAAAEDSPAETEKQPKSPKMEDGYEIPDFIDDDDDIIKIKDDD